MKNKNTSIVSIALIVALGGLLMGFDASVISGVVKFIEPEFNLSSLELGWSVASLTLTATLAMMLAGPLSDKLGRRTVLRYAAILYAISAIGSALAPTFIWLVVARMVGGFGVGASLILAPMYIAEISPPQLRGRMVSFNQLNIVIGISLAFFTNYLILQLGKSDAEWALALKFDENNWRWMLGLETLPAVLYFLGLFFVPRSPRWCVMHGEMKEAYKTISRLASEEVAKKQIKDITLAIASEANEDKGNFVDLFAPSMRLVLTIGIVVAILQQITGINSVFFYAPLIFEQSGLGTDAAFVQAILVGLVNLGFTILAMIFIDKLGRKPLLTFGVAGIAIAMFLLSYGFQSATFTLQESVISTLPEGVRSFEWNEIVGNTYESEGEFQSAVESIIGKELFIENKTDLVNSSIQMNTMLILFAILGFVASFAISIGPVMWVLFSELFPNRIRGIAISFVGLINSAVSFLVQWIFPWELEVLGSSITFLIYGVFAAFGLVFIVRVIPETKGKSLEELEEELVK
ncbi:sugar porter family MFS transporter [Algoriphagus sediminis]|uniref:Sugar porter family MFS transporter n=1 Tax=Algoriphagus sediminis TaxID=3057113 RepID=A0ABT7YDS7_9BACT|nr:sugar porter family MFS transporter [Algoriphagus sediminis]MDN3204643.1 sugar porter family MFS transporter [Algoriphagus sediminis]